MFCITSMHVSNFISIVTAINQLLYKLILILYLCGHVVCVVFGVAAGCCRVFNWRDDGQEW